EGSVAAPIRGEPGSERLRFKDFEFQRLASGRCRAKVVLTSSDGREFLGESEGIISQAGELRCGAAATVRALERVVQPKPGLALMLAACGGAQGPHAGAVAPVVRDSGAARTVDSLGAAIARVAQDSAADQQVLDSLHRTAPRPDSVRARRDSTAAPAVKGEE